MLMYSEEHLLYLKKNKRKKIITKVAQLSIIIIFLLTWQLLANFTVINTFLFSSPKDIFETIIKLSKENLISHIWITFYETIISFLIASILGIMFWHIYSFSFSSSALYLSPVKKSRDTILLSDSFLIFFFAMMIPPSCVSQVYIRKHRLSREKLQISDICPLVITNLLHYNSLALDERR